VRQYIRCTLIDKKYDGKSNEKLLTTFQEATFFSGKEIERASRTEFWVHLFKRLEIQKCNLEHYGFILVENCGGKTTLKTTCNNFG